MSEQRCPICEGHGWLNYPPGTPAGVAFVSTTTNYYKCHRCGGIGTLRDTGAGEGTSDPEEVMSPEPANNTDAGLPVAPPAPEPLPSVDDVIALADEFAYAVERHINIESKLRNLRAAIERLHKEAVRER